MLKQMKKQTKKQKKKREAWGGEAGRQVGLGGHIQDIPGGKHVLLQRVA